MTSIAVEISTEASPSVVWDAIRDIGALHTRLVPGFVVATELVPGGRRARFRFIRERSGAAVWCGRQTCFRTKRPRKLAP